MTYILFDFSDSNYYVEEYLLNGMLGSISIVFRYH